MYETKLRPTQDAVLNLLYTFFSSMKLVWQIGNTNKVKKSKVICNKFKSELNTIISSDTFLML